MTRIAKSGEHEPCTRGWSNGNLASGILAQFVRGGRATYIYILARQKEGRKEGEGRHEGGERQHAITNRGIACTPGVVGLADDQRGYTLFVERAEMHEISPSTCVRYERTFPLLGSEGSTRRGEPRGSSPTRPTNLRDRNSEFES